jgi:uncharacterized protein (TIGR04255 family)
MTRLYRNAPIAEAVIDLKVEWPAGDSLESLDSLASDLSLQFPTSGPLQTLELELQAAADAEPQVRTDRQLIGRRLDNAARTRVLQVQRAGFTYSHLPPYTDWTTFRGEALPLWTHYVAVARVTHATRIAVRVINRLALAGEVGDVSKYCTLGLSVPAIGFPKPGKYFLQAQIDADTDVPGCKVIVNSGAAVIEGGRYELLLDFDLYCEGRWNTAVPDIWSLLDEMSVLKDKIFEACITDDLRSIIE